MSGKERFEGIKMRYTDDLVVAKYSGITLTESDYKFLIRQSEEKQDLEVKNVFLDNFIDHLCDKFNVSREQAEQEFR